MRVLFLFTLVIIRVQMVSAQNIGIGTATPLSKLHIYSGASGFASTPFSPLVVEGSGNIYLNFLTPNLSESGILFGKASDASSGGIVYNNTGNLNGLQFRTNGNNTRMIIDNNGRVGIGVTPTISDGVFEVNGRMRIRSGGSLANSAGLWLNNTNNSGQAAFFGMEDDTHVGFFGSTSGWSLTMNTVTGRVGIGITNPNAPLAFPPSLGKKITLYPGLTGDVGFGVAGNRLQIYSDNPNADVAMGYDAAGVFNERFAVKPNGALAVVGNTGTAGQVLQSAGPSSAAQWQSLSNILATYYLYNNAGGGSYVDVTTDNEYELVNSTFTFTVSANSRLIISAGYNVYGFCPFIGSCETRAFCYFKVDGNSTYNQRVSIKSSGNGEASGTLSNFYYDVTPGTHTIKFYTKRDSFSGSVEYFGYLVNATIMVLPL